AFCAIARFGGAGGDVQRGEVRAQRGLVEGLDAKAQVVEVAPFAARCRAAGASELAVQRDEIQHRAAGAKLDQADLVLAPLDAAAQAVAVEAQHGRHVDHAQHDVVDLADMDHRRGSPGASVPRDAGVARASRDINWRAACRWAPAGTTAPAAPGSTAAGTAP